MPTPPSPSIWAWKARWCVTARLHPVEQQLALGAAADERGPQRGAAACRAATTGSTASQASTGSSRPRACRRAHRLVLDDRLGGGVGRRPDEDAPGRRGHLQPLGDVDRVTKRGVVAAGPQRPDQHLAGVHPDAHLHADEPSRAGVLGERLLHPQRGAHGPLGVVLVGDGRPEQRHDGVADDLVDAPAEGRRCRATRRSKHPSTMLLTCSGSRDSDSVVNPTRSANRTVATRRSSGLGAAAGVWPQLRAEAGALGQEGATGRAWHSRERTAPTTHPPPSVTRRARPAAGRGTGHMVEAPRPPAVAHRIRPRADDTGHLNVGEDSHEHDVPPRAPDRRRRVHRRRRQDLRVRRERSPRPRRRHRPVRPGRLHRDHGPLGLGQVDADALRRRPRPPHVRQGASSAAPTCRPCRTSSSRSLRRDKVGFVFQAFNLIPTLDAYENITLPIALAGRKPDQAWVDSVIDHRRACATA